MATIIVAACGGQSSGNQAQTFKGTKKVGYSAPLTGQSALYGHAVSQALNLADTGSILVRVTYLISDFGFWISD